MCLSATRVFLSVRKGQSFFVEVHHPDVREMLANGEIEISTIGGEVSSIGRTIWPIEVDDHMRVGTVGGHFGDVVGAVETEHAIVDLLAVETPAADLSDGADYVGWYDDAAFTGCQRENLELSAGARAAGTREARRDVRDSPAIGRPSRGEPNFVGDLARFATTQRGDPDIESVLSIGGECDLLAIR